MMRAIGQIKISIQRFPSTICFQERRKAPHSLIIISYTFIYTGTFSLAWNLQQRQMTGNSCNNPNDGPICGFSIPHLQALSSEIPLIWCVHKGAKLRRCWDGVAADVKSGLYKFLKC